MRVAAPPSIWKLTDTDRDGLPDEWETEHGLNPLDPLDGLADTDGDGFTNLAEYQADTDPRTAESSLRIERVDLQVDGSCWLQFHAMSNKTYCVEVCDEAPGNGWRSLTDIVVLTENDTLDGGDVVPGWTIAVKDIFA